MEPGNEAVKIVIGQTREWNVFSTEEISRLLPAARAVYSNHKKSGGPRYVNALRAC